MTTKEFIEARDIALSEQRAEMLAALRDAEARLDLDLDYLRAYSHEIAVKDCERTLASVRAAIAKAEEFQKAA